MCEDAGCVGLVQAVHPVHLLPPHCAPLPLPLHRAHRASASSRGTTRRTRVSEWEQARNGEVGSAHGHPAVFTPCVCTPPASATALFSGSAFREKYKTSHSPLNVRPYVGQLAAQYPDELDVRLRQLSRKATVRGFKLRGKSRTSFPCPLMAHGDDWFRGSLAS